MKYPTCLLTILLFFGIISHSTAQKNSETASFPRGRNPKFILAQPSADYLRTVEEARQSHEDYFFKKVLARPEGPTYENVKDFLAPLRHVTAPWKYVGIVLSPKGSPQKMRMIENGFRIDANLTRRTPIDPSQWTSPDTYLTVCVGAKDELFGQDEQRQGAPSYEEGYLPIVHVAYESEETRYEETVFAGQLLTDYRSPHLGEPGTAAYIQITAKNGPGRVSFEVVGPDVNYGFPIVSGGFRNDRFTDAHNNVFAFFSPGGVYDAKARLIRFDLQKGESARVVLPHALQPAGTRVKVDAAKFEKAHANSVKTWKEELAKGGQVEVPEEVVMNAYRSLLIGDWQLTIGDELPYGMFSSYQGIGYPEALQSISPFIEYGYNDDAQRFIQLILDYPLSDTGVGLHVCANRLELAASYYAMSKDAEFIRRNKDLLIEVAEYFLNHRKKETGLVMDGYGFDVQHLQIVNLNTNSNGWRAIRNLGLILREIGDTEAGDRYLKIAEEFGNQIRKAVNESINRSTTPPFVPFALYEKELYSSLIEDVKSNYYNLVMPYFFESEIFEPKSEAYTSTLDYMWQHQGVMAGLNRYSIQNMVFQDGIHPLYSWGRQFNQIARHDTTRAIYTFYCTLAHGYTRGTFITGETQGTRPYPNQWYRVSSQPPEPPANAMFLRSLRHILLHEHDQQQDGNYDQLWLLSSAPPAWFEDGKSIRLNRMPSRFGPVSLTLDSKIKHGKLAGKLTLEKGAERKEILLFVRPPKEYHVKGGLLENGTPLKQTTMDGDTVLWLPAKMGSQEFSVEVERL